MSRTAQSAVVTVVVMVGIACLAGGLNAQDGALELLQVSIVNVVPERWDDYIELQLEEVNPALQRAGVPWRSVWRTAEFGNTYEIQFIAPLGDLAELDTGGPLARVMDPDRRTRLLDRIRRFTSSRRSYAVQYRPDLSVEPDEVGGLFLARVSTIQVTPGRAAEWQAFLERSMPKFRAAGVVFGVYQRLFGPGPTTWQIVENHASFTELAQPSIVTRAFGDRADVAASELAGLLVSIERAVLRYDAELSYSGIPSR